MLFFNIRNYLPVVSNIQQREAELNIVVPRVHRIFVLLYTPSTKQSLG